jgi:membrane-associated phospholipid phosphatase
VSAGPPRPAQGAPARVPVLPAGRQRRPSGAAPPLPRHIQRGGLIWLAAAIVAAGAAIAVFAGGLSRWAVDVTVIDDAMTRRVADVPVPGFTAAARVIAEAGAAPAAVIAGYVLLLALIVLRRFRQLLVLVASYWVLTLLTTAFLLIVHRPLPFGVPVQFRWAGFAMPSAEIEKVCAVLTGALYTLVPAGRWRRRGGWAAAAIVLVIGVSRMRPGVDAPTDVLLGAVLGVTVPLLGMRLFAPEESFPVVYGGAHGAHLDLGGARGEEVADAVRVVRESGLPNRTDAMFTTIEGDWDQAMAVVKQAVQVIERLDQAAGLRGQVGDGFGERVRGVMLGRGSLRRAAPGGSSLRWGAPGAGTPFAGGPVSAASREPVMQTPTRYQATGRADATDRVDYVRRLVRRR